MSRRGGRQSGRFSLGNSVPSPVTPFPMRVVSAGPSPDRRTSCDPPAGESEPTSSHILDSVIVCDTVKLRATTLSDPNAKKPLTLRLESSGLRARTPVIDPASSGARQRSDSLTDAIFLAVRTSLELARDAGDRVSVVLRGDPTRGLPIRTIEGIVTELNVAPDGRDRVVLDIAEGSSQIILVERIVRVMPVK